MLQTLSDFISSLRATHFHKILLHPDPPIFSRINFNEGGVSSHSKSAGRVVFRPDIAQNKKTG